MKSIAIVCLLVAGATANYNLPTLVRSVAELPSYSSYSSSVRSAAPIIPITRFSQELVGGISDSHEFETGNGIRVQESTQVVQGRGSSYEDENGQLVQSDSSLTKSGSFSYTAADGTPISLSWTADENGFRASGAHLPTPPPVPAEILASLNTVSSSSGSDDGSYHASVYEAPTLLRSSYSAPIAVRSESYSAPVAVRSSYSAPIAVRSEYAAPIAVRVAPAPIVIRSSGY